jgi:hypothetical protein
MCWKTVFPLLGNLCFCATDEIQSAGATPLRQCAAQALRNSRERVALRLRPAYGAGLAA